MLRKIRIILAALFIVGITLLFAGIGADGWGWMAKLQFLPSCLGLNFLTIGIVLALTLVFGRLYCSVICPLGVFQDLIIFLRRKLSRKLCKKKKSKAKVFVAEHKIARYGIFVVFIAAIIFDFQVLIALIAPYSSYGRMITTLLHPQGAVLAVTAAVSFIVIALCAWLLGREWCNTVCPVGTALGLVSRFSLFRPVIDLPACINCKKCARECKAHCINPEEHKIDASRCVVCFDCLENCSTGAIHYRFLGRPKTAGADGAPKAAKSSKAAIAADRAGRRSFIATGAFLGASLAASAQIKKNDGGLAEITPKTTPERAERLVPFGAGSVENFYDRCTGCQLCVSNCPNGVLRPSSDLEHLLQPQMGYEKGFCRPECTSCGDVCPAGAILPVSKEEKLNIHIGTAHVNLELCLAAKGDASCGNCSHHCPVGAIRMVHSEKYGHHIPVVAEEQCIGCGACEYLCPSNPVSAITVDGLSIHRHN